MGPRVRLTFTAMVWPCMSSVATQEPDMSAAPVVALVVVVVVVVVVVLAGAAGVGAGAAAAGAAAGARCGAGAVGAGLPEQAAVKVARLMKAAEVMRMM